jgi:hypothetical protein
VPAPATEALEAPDQFTCANMLAEGFDVHLQKPSHLLRPQGCMIHECRFDRVGNVVVKDVGHRLALIGAGYNCG